ncbi:MAG: AAA family ATPase [Pseudanabaena sp. M114S2SP2A07QC]|uniref:AAA family ATPase n=1 Tax=Microcystis sp. M135S2 TaxID=2771144 RepID=UPI00258E0CC7|nr:AAA family ATPase [Microcystis sp. M135S2]MCA6532872.1 AAA family ATPase [Pseudanabaena sp. M176S2SP2A07QC]MCA6540838.1 AAA family ATPase [Pseudanabaena sp. M037S2SP2A07QC]MCA6550209.1 AAA family ATPase [Pseudanabaena sp. M152S2SP2A07QC]MCA6555462.1 AAA family ATPase [Pseudanabaena sp. M114S2SP2A07QC]MCA6567065.1 AAA family ATPase [Pseudanabaena sp. M151S2SP2A07QC]MCA6568322.1 AAA family ATPase [Pseudanabaena sp. M065S1SP2A07QC]MCA6577668.1 AAA family ATPase [Pseudanabaena sp. M085S1SP2A0
MLKKIIHIKNLGLFNDASCTSPLFDKVNLIYADNGRGKSTLASILRSCSKNDAESITLRQAVYSDQAPEIKFLFNNGTSNITPTFNGSEWSHSYSDILVFDTEFVDKNVYSGTVIEASHRQGLLEFSLGEDAVLLKQQVDSETQKISDKTREISSIESSLTPYRKDLNLRDFAKLSPDPDVETKIESLKTRLTAAKNNESLQKKAIPQLLTEPKLNLEAFFAILTTTLEDIEKDAENTVQSHISKYSNGDFENWLSQGQSFENRDECLYCGQSIVSNNLIKAYKTHFNQGYRDLKEKVCKLPETIDRRLSDGIIDTLISTVEKNQSVIDEWMNHVSFPPCKYELNNSDLFSGFEEIRNILHGLANKKIQNPLELVINEIDQERSQSLWNDFILSIKTYNQLIGIPIFNIDNFKVRLAGESVQNIEKEIEILNLTKVRHEPTVCSLFERLNALKEEKKEHEIIKLSARNSLDNLMTQTLGNYQTQINNLVRDFGALFEIAELNHDYRGTGTPRSNYGLKVKGYNIKLSTDESAPSFANALSEGDKRTLAFAFFIARLQSDPNLTNKVVVIDDPVCSLDHTRRNKTKRILRDIGLRSSQLIVLGHDKYFLKELCDDFTKIDIPPMILKIHRIGNDYSDFTIFDIAKECASSYYSHHEIVKNFVEGSYRGELRTVVKAIRPLLEKYLHLRFPSYIQQSTLFGKIIGDAKVAELPNPLVYLQPLANELNEINDYAGQFYHDASAAEDNNDIVESELRIYAQRALDVIYKGFVNEGRESS